MGQYAEDIIDNYCDSLGDYIAEYNVKRNRYAHYKLTPSEINFKYGKGWRERGLVVNSDDQWKPLNEY